MPLLPLAGRTRVVFHVSPEKDLLTARGRDSIYLASHSINDSMGGPEAFPRAGSGYARQLTGSGDSRNPVMRPVVAVAMLGVCLLSQGCSLADIATHLVTGRIRQSLSDYQERKRDRQWAEDAWRDIQNAHPGAFSEDYALGFKTGFADFLYNGGDGEPPALAPERYRTIHYQSLEGYRAAEDWFAGY